LDTARSYKNEKDVGEGIRRAIKDGSVKREEIYVITKVWHSDKANPEESLRGSLADLGLDYVDLFLDHWSITICDDPNGKKQKVPLHESWPKMEALVEKGLTKSIGVSNYGVQHLMNLLSFCKIKPVVNEIEYHPYLVQSDLKYFCQTEGVQIIAFNSLIKGKYVNTHFSTANLNVMEEPIVVEMSKKYQKTPGQIVLNWALVQDIVVIPASSNPKRFKENAESMNFRLSKEDVEKVSSVNKNFRTCTTATLGFCYGYEIFA